VQLIIPVSVHAQITRHLESTYPNEGGGFLIGQADGERVAVVECRPVTNIFETEEQYHRYLMEEGAFQAAEDYADTHGLALVGYFHSHPESPAVPSEFDRVHALPNFLYLILSVQQGRAVDSRGWLLADSRDRFQAVQLTVDEGQGEKTS
jgi:proteasome lid subunit RPN8/RPN11